MVNARAVVPFPGNYILTNQEKVKAEQEKIIKEIKNLQKQDRKALKEISNELKRLLEEKNDRAPSDDENCMNAERR
jgi:hypothetical protein